MWHSVQVHSLERANNQHIVGKLRPFSLGTLEFTEAYGIGKRTYQATIGTHFRLVRAEFFELSHMEVLPTKQSPNQGFKRYIVLNLNNFLLEYIFTVIQKVW